jgi:acetyltransferase
MLASASPEVYGTCLKILLEDPAVDGVMVILPPPPMYTAEDVASKLIEVSRKFDKPVVVALLGSTLIEKAGALLQGAGIPAYPFPERAASAFGALAVRARHLTTALPSLVAGEPPHPPAPVGALPADELIAAYGIRTNPLKLARDSAEAASIAKEIGFPVVMKIASPEIAHKSDIGGVLLGIQNAAGASDGYTILMDRAHRHNPQARIEGVHIQRQVQGGQEVIVGAVRDPQFGHMMMFGSGGVEVEGLRDVAFALAPLDHAAAQGLIRDTWAGRKLAGYRNFPAVDEAAAIEALVKLSKLVRDQPAIEEIEINPLVVSDHGAIALDVRMKINPQ